MVVVVVWIKKDVFHRIGCIDDGGFNCWFCLKKFENQEERVLVLEVVLGLGYNVMISNKDMILIRIKVGEYVLILSVTL